MTKLDTILFDFDGTLIDTDEIIIRSFDATFKKHFPDLVLSRDTIIGFIGPSLQETFGEFTKDPFLIDDMIKTYREFYVVFEINNFKLFPNVLDVVKDLSEKGYNLGIVTSKFKEAAWPSFSFYNLQDYFKVFVALDDVSFAKPNREPIDLALSRFPSYHKAIMIGDNKGDILAGKNAGIYSAGVAWSIKGAEYLQTFDPDFMIYDIRDIYEIIEKIERE
ncbi:MAG: pyrophosphatase PpaX [Firmicutes bacterium]|nr:pyrophosphatase PpaX [Bacillota bacterium]